MIFVTLGTQDKSFERLLKDIKKQIDLENIKEKVVVQAGFTKFDSKDMEIFDLISMDEFDRLMNECDLLITHGGVGSIISGLKKNKKVIAVARLAKYKEHMNDHQKQIVDNFSEAGYILKYDENDDLKEILDKIKTFKPKKYVSNTDNMIKLVTEKIDELVGK